LFGEISAIRVGISMTLVLILVVPRDGGIKRSGRKTPT
jgi:hypothetical protein